MAENREKQGQLLLEAISGIDGDLLRDVEPAAPARIARPARPRARRGWVSAAAVLLILIAGGLVIRLVLWSGKGMDQAAVPREEASSLDPVPPEAVFERGQEGTEASPKTDDVGMAGLPADTWSHVGQSAPEILSGGDDRVYSPQGMDWALAYLSALFDGREAASCPAVEFSGPGNLQFDNYLLISETAETGQIDSLPIEMVILSHLDDDCLGEILASGQTWEGPCPDDLRGPALEGRALLQRLSATVALEVAEGAGKTADGLTFETIPEARIYGRDIDRAVMAELPVGQAKLRLVLPDPSTTVDCLFEEDDFFSWLAGPFGGGGMASIRLPLFQLTSDHDGIEVLGALGEQSSGFQLVRQRTSFGWLPVPVGSAGLYERVIDFDRPFLFALVDGEGQPLALGVLRSLFNQS